MDSKCLVQVLAVLVVLASYCFLPVYTKKVPSICGRYNKPSKDSIFVAKCKVAGHLKGCCCIDEENTVVGLDVTNCNISDVSHQIKITEFPKVFILLLDHNPLKDPPKEEQFLGLTALNYLSLPQRFDCPGGVKSWKNSSTERNMTLCKDQINNCLNVTCPTQTSKCVPDGPGLSRCVCDDGWTAYKCLRKEGKFPLVIVLSCLAGSAVLTTILIWFINKKGKRNATRFGYQSWNPDEQEVLIRT